VRLFFEEKVEDWHNLAIEALSLNAHYNPEVKIISSEVSGSEHQTKMIAEYMERGPSGEWRSKVK